MSGTDELTAFALARLDDDARFIKVMTEAGQRKADTATPADLADAYGLLMTVMSDPQAKAEVERWIDDSVPPPTSSARILADIEAKRARVALMAEATAEMDRLLADPHAGRVDQAMAIGRARGATVAVKHDAAVWAAHPDYQARWKP